METNVQSAYNQWAKTYDDIENKTRDLDKIATAKMLSELITPSTNVLEFGCGTGKNTEWLKTKTNHLTAVDFSEEMLAKAKEKLAGFEIEFLQADITQKWPFANNCYDVVICNLILEHVEHLDNIFFEAKRVLKTGGHFFISELHPSKQYLGARANFKLDEQTVSPDCYVHHVSDYFSSALSNSFICADLKEWFDGDKDRTHVPRIISFLFRKAE